MPILALAGLAMQLVPLSEGARLPCSLRDLRQCVPNVVGGYTALADLDGDGAPELVLSSGSFGGAPKLLVNDGHGNFSPEGVGDGATELELSGPLAAGDLNGDGLEDVVDGGTVLLADGGRGLRVAAVLVPQTFFEEVRLADLDRDGDLDVIIGERTGPFSGNITLWRNEGGGSFSSFGRAVEGRQPREADFDGDGDVDLLALRSGALQVLYNDGAYAFEPAPSPLVVSKGVFAVADFDGNGLADVLVGLGTFPSGYLSLFRNVGAGVFEEELVGSRDANELAIEDLDRDGDLDALSLLPALLLLNDGSGAFVDATGQLPANATSSNLAVGDVDRDGDPDLVAKQTDSLAGLFLNDGAATFLAAERRFPLDPSPPLAVEDLDADGDLDVLTGRGIVRNLGHGSLEEAPELLDEKLTTSADADTGDVNGDGAVDLLWVGSGRQLFLAEGASFRAAPASSFPSGGSSFAEVELEDFDGDGDLDTFLAGGGPSYSYLGNNGQGTFATGPALPGTAALTHALAVGDVDGDGALDLWLGHSGPDTLFLGAGTGAFANASSNLPPSKATRDIALADLDRDGDLDAFTVGFIQLQDAAISLPDRILANDGEGSFAITAEHPTLEFHPSVEAADFDDDGDVDAVVGAGGATILGPPRNESVLLYANDGAGRMTSFAALPSLDERFMLAGDFDGDGDTDVVTRSRILTNKQRALAWRGLPRAGRPLQLDLFGSRSASYLLFLSTGTSSGLRTDFGRLWLDPAGLFWMTEGTLSSVGRAHQRFLVPAALAGRTLYWQALIGAPARLSNLEPTELVAY